MSEEIFKEKGTRSMDDKELFTEQVSYSHIHTDLEGFVCPKCGWCVPKISTSSFNQKNILGQSEIEGGKANPSPPNSQKENKTL